MDDDAGPFCSPFDRRLAEQGPPAVFLRDPEGRLRLDPEWTRDAWARLKGRDSGYVQLVLATSPDLLAEHPRLQCRAFEEAHLAEEVLAALGRPPVVKEPW
jgi:hypothetical protein